MTRSDKPNTFELTDYDIETEWEAFEKDDNYVNPWSPSQVNSWGRKLCMVEDTFVNLMADRVAQSVGVPVKA